MKVLLVSSNSGSRGGGEIYLSYLAKGLADKGCCVNLLVSNDPAMDQIAGELARAATVHRLTLTNTYHRRSRSLGAVLDLRQRRRVSEFIHGIDPDIVHVNQQVAEDGLDLLLAARDSAKPVVSTIHITHSAERLGARLGVLRDFVAERALLRLKPSIICVSEAATATLRARGRLRALDISTIHPAAPSPDALALRAARQNARRDWGVSIDEIVVGAVGRIEPQKNPVFLLDAFAHAAKALPNLKLVWIGDGTMRSTLEVRTRLRGLENCVIVEGWRDDARLRLAGFDIFAMPSRFEGLPLALLEAMHAGLAICTSDADGIVDAITSGLNGVICRASSTDVWGDALCRLAESVEWRASLGLAARKIALDNYSIPVLAQATLGQYERVIPDFERC